MSTFGAPGPTIVPPWAVMSPTLAAGGIRVPLVDLYEAALDVRIPPASMLGHRVALQR